MRACNVVDEPPEGARHRSRIFNKAFSLEKTYLRVGGQTSAGTGAAEYTSPCQCVPTLRRYALALQSNV